MAVEQRNGKVLRSDIEEMKKLEQKKSEEALLLVQKQHILIRYQNERDEARKAAEIWKLERDKEGGGLTGLSLL